MMRNVYTAQEMRAFADAIAGDLCGNGHRVEYTYDDLIPVIESLRQAADEMERNESLLNKAGATVVELMNKMNAQHAEIARLRKIVNELADALNIAREARPDLVIIDDPCDLESAREVAK